MKSDQASRDAETRVLDLLRQCEPQRPEEALRLCVRNARPTSSRSWEDRLLTVALCALVLSFGASSWMERAAARQMADVGLRAQSVNTSGGAAAAAKPEPISVGLFALRRSLPLPMGATSPYVELHELLSTSTSRISNDV